MPATLERSRLGLDDPAKFRTIRRVAVLDAHETLLKTIYDPAAISPANPGGKVKRALAADAADLAVLAHNANARVQAGSPPVLQLGHTPQEDLPELDWPRHVGFASNFRVEPLAGIPALYADLSYLASEFDEAATFPRLSVERVGWMTPETHQIDRIALLRRRPDRDLPAVPYGHGSKPLPRILYSKEIDLPAPVVAASGAHEERQRLVALMARFGLTPEQARRRIAGEARERANYARDAAAAYRVPAPTPDRAALIDWCSRMGITNLEDGRRRFEAGR